MEQRVERLPRYQQQAALVGSDPSSQSASGEGARGGLLAFPLVTRRSLLALGFSRSPCSFPSGFVSPPVWDRARIHASRFRLFRSFRFSSSVAFVRLVDVRSVLVV